MDKSIHVSTIEELHKYLGYKRPLNSLISIINMSRFVFPKEYIFKKITTDFYTVFIKNRCFGKLIYGRNLYDFQDGVLAFMGPRQSFVLEEIYEDIDVEGYILFFHPDLLKNNFLEMKINEYNFFSYNINEALHLSDKEKKIIYKILADVEKELIYADEYSNEIIVSSIELLLKYSQRFYSRQFKMRESLNKKVIEEFQDFLYKEIVAKDENNKIPTVKECAEKFHYSSNYFSDMLKKETGKSTKEHILFYLVEKAKTMLMDSTNSVNEIAYKLGFEYPEHFSKIFKKKVGLSPLNYRNTKN